MGAIDLQGVSRTTAAHGWRRIDRRLLGVQYLRALAALVVLVAHGAPALVAPIIAQLALVLDLFFLISGFLVVVISDDETRPGDFLVDRILRIVPLYWTLTLACFVLIYSGILIPTIDPLQLARGMISGDWRFLACSLAFVPCHGPFEPDLNPLVPQGWTLAYEMFFYLLFACALWLPRRRTVPALTALFAGLVLAGTLIEGGAAFRFWTSPIVFEFIFGLWVGVAWQRGWDYRWVLLGLCLAWMPLIAVTDASFVGWPFHPNRMHGLPYVLILFVATIALDRRSGLPEWRWLRLIGDGSYSIYLFQFIPIILLDRAEDAMPVSSTLRFVVVAVGGLGGGLLCYAAIERPMMRLVRTIRARRRAARA